MRQVRVPSHIKVSPDNPDSTQPSRDPREAHTGDEQRGEHAGVVLGVVCVRALRAVEAVRVVVVLGYLVGGVGGGVGDAGGFAEFASVEAVDGVEDEGGCGGEDYVSGLGALAGGSMV
ncbi:hypothetical protein V500_08647 [Pseudogymnoascus sp. VKM F-4518 (FW-2643)]|nr:hypothetical protein V500_08647 [Pseudogymnoascus sp. VKM F-4518 (FW-2643)]